MDIRVVEVATDNGSEKLSIIINPPQTADVVHWLLGDGECDKMRGELLSTCRSDPIRKHSAER